MAASMTLRQEPADRPIRPAAARGTSIQTVTARFGHSGARVPETPHITAYPRVFAIGALRRASAKPLQVGTFAVRGFWRSA